MIDSKEIATRAQFVPMEQAAKQLPALCQSLAGNPDAVVAVTNHGQPAFALISWESWQELEDMAATLETLEILADSKTSAALRQARTDLADASSDTIPGEVVMQQLIEDGLLDPAKL